MKRFAFLLVLLAAAACSDDPTGPSEPPPDTGILVENATGSNLTVRIIECGFGEVAAQFTVSSGQENAAATVAGCWHVDVWTADDRYGATELEISDGTLRTVVVRSADSDDIWRATRVIIDVDG